MKKIAALVMAMSLVCSAATVYVDAGASGSNDGTSWANAYSSLSTALSSSTAGDSLWVKAGTYKPGTARNETFTVNKTLNIYGGFDGTETMEAQRNPSSNPTILSGDIGVANDNSDNSYTVITLTSGTITLDGFTIRDGKSQSSSSASAGLKSGVNVDLTMKNCKFLSNEAGLGSGSGGGASVITPFMIEDCYFSQNSAGSGAALSLSMNGSSGNALVKDCQFLYNSAEHSSGGAIQIGTFFNSTITPVINNCSFITNTSAQSGGAVTTSAANTSFVGCTFITNSTDNFGGAINSAAATITSCTFDSNNATSGNGGAINASKASTIDRCYFTFNSAYYSVAGNGQGGAVSLTGLSTDNNMSVVSNSIFWGNYGEDNGSAAYTLFRDTKFTNCTFLENDGNGHTIFRAGDKPVSVFNSILWGNYSASGEVNSFPSLVVQYTDIEGGWTGTGNINSDPLLTTDFPDTLNWWPDTGSPALEAGNDALIVGSSDIVGNTRDVGTVDMGAVEKQ